MMLAWFIIAACGAAALAGGSFTIGRYFPARAAVDEKYNQAVNTAYDQGWEDCRDRSADPPGPYSGMCPGGRRCVNGPEPHQWSASCEQDEGWAGLDDEPMHAPSADHPVYRNTELEQPAPEPARLPTAEERTQMFAELAPDDERPAGHTDQFRAIGWDDMPWSERQGLIEWDFVMKSRRQASDFEEFSRDYIAEWREELENRGAA